MGNIHVRLFYFRASGSGDVERKSLRITIAHLEPFYSCARIRVSEPRLNNFTKLFMMAYTKIAQMVPLGWIKGPPIP